MMGGGPYVLHRALAAGAGPALAPTSTVSPTATGTGDATSIQHVPIACQENRSFDTYFGVYPKAGSYGIPPNYTQPDGNGGTVTPQHASQPTSKDISHTWSSIHSEWDNGAMDGFVTTDGAGSLIYYDGSDLPYYYALADDFTLCGNYFCSLLGPTDPNRLYLWTATAGGNTSNSIKHCSLDWPAIVDLLDAQQIS